MRKQVYLAAIILGMSLLASCSSGSGASGTSDYDYNSSSSYNDFSATTDSFSSDVNGIQSVMGASKSEDNYYVEESSTTSSSIEMPDEESVKQVESTSSTTKLVESKLVYHERISIETREFDNSYSNLKDLVEKYNGIIEEENFYNNSGSYLYSYDYSETQRRLDILIRIPTENYDSFNEEYGVLGNVVSKSSNVQNITEKYYSSQATLDGLKKQLSRLQDMMNSAYEINDMIAINREITSVENEINSLSNDIRVMDMDVAYSYVNIGLTEVLEYSEIEPAKKHNKFIDRLENTVKETWEDLLAFLEGLLFLIIKVSPYIIIIGLIFIIIRVIKKLLRIPTKKDVKDKL